MQVIIKPEQMAVVSLTPEDAKLFAEFQKRYSFVKLMDSIGAFDVKSGSVTVHFNNIGEIASIDKQQHYRI